jgi:hypothetical protein
VFWNAWDEPRGLRDLVWNERLKLLASALNGVATADVGMGFFAPIAALLYGTSVVAATAPLRLAAALWHLVAVFIHGLAQVALGRLRA